MKIPKWVTKKPIVSDVEYLIKSTLKHNNKKYKSCIYRNNRNGALGSHRRVGHK